MYRFQSLQEGHLPELPEEPLQRHWLQRQENTEQTKQQDVLKNKS